MVGKSFSHKSRWLLDRICVKINQPELDNVRLFPKYVKMSGTCLSQRLNCLYYYVSPRLHISQLPTLKSKESHLSLIVKSYLLTLIILCLLAAITV